MPFCSGATDTFEFSSKHLGEIAGICLGHITKDGKKPKSEIFWHVMELVVTEKELGNKWVAGKCDIEGVYQSVTQHTPFCLGISSTVMQRFP